MKFFLSCTGFPSCKYAIWLPDAVTGARVAESVTSIGEKCIPAPCIPCTSRNCLGAGRLIALKFRPGTRLPSGYVQEDQEMEYVYRFSPFFLNKHFFINACIPLAQGTWHASSVTRSSEWPLEFALQHHPKVKVVVVHRVLPLLGNRRASLTTDPPIGHSLLSHPLFDRARYDLLDSLNCPKLRLWLIFINTLARTCWYY